MYKYEKIEYNYGLPTRLLNFYIKNNIGEMIEKHWHRSLEILIPCYGAFKLWINGEFVEMRPGRIYIINSHDLHSINAVSGQFVYIGYALQIDYDYLKANYEDFDSIYFRQPNKRESKSLLRQIMKVIKCYSEKEKFHDIKLKSMIQMLVFSLLDNFSTPRNDYLKVKDGKNKDRITRVINYMEKNYQNDLSLKTIADEFKISEGYLSKLFKDNLNITVKEYLERLRLWHGEAELLNTDYPIIDIAISSGFPNVKSFNRAFKEKNTLTPAKYREKMKNKNLS